MFNLFRIYYNSFIIKIKNVKYQVFGYWQNELFV